MFSGNLKRRGRERVNADDGMVMMQTLQEAKESIQKLSNIAKDCG